MIRVMVVASALAVRAGLRALLSSGAGIEVTGEAARLADLLLSPPPADVLVVEAGAATEADLERALRAPQPLALLLLVVDDLPALQALPELARHAWGVLPFDCSAEELLAAVSALHEGLLVGSPGLLAALLRPGKDSEAGGEEIGAERLADPLTERETQVLQLLAQGLANKQIARALGISEHTVKFHVSAIYGKLGVASRTEAVRSGVRRGLVVL